MACDGTGLISLQDVSKTYSTGALSFTALRDVDLEVQPGEFVAVIGPSGSGKSTLLHLMAAIDRPTAGTVTIGGVDVSSLTEDGAARWRGRTVGVVFQFFQLLPTLTLVENVMLPMDFCDVHARRDRPRVARELLARVGLADQVDKLPSQVSGGQQQRAAIARALANNPPILFGDEPTGNLDSAATAKVMDLFEELARDGRTIVMVTHDRDLAERAARTVQVVDGVVSDHAGSDRR